MESLKLEIVRPGPLYGQLLSRLTGYVALCDGIEADTVRFPFDHYELKAELKALRYYVGRDEREWVPNSLRADSAERLSRRLADSLGQMPALQTRLAESHCGNSVRHLRLVLGGSELSLVPFELATIPLGWRGAGSKLSLAPIVVTRELRESSRMPVRWNRPPRILFCTACPKGFAPPPVDAHLLAIMNAVRDRVDNGSKDIDARLSRVVTLLEDASLPAISKAIEVAAAEDAPYTYVHFLCHGCPMPEQPERFGIALAKERAPQELDAVDARKLSAAFLGRTYDRVPPTMVVFATCDSANQATVEVPGSSLAYELHQKGVPWVLASQLPLTYRGSATLTRVWYEGVLEGLDPRIVLHHLRQELSRDESTHDWASLVAYAALPADFERQVRSFRIRQLRELIESAFARLATVSERTSLSAARTKEFGQIDHYLTCWRRAIDELKNGDPERTEFHGMEGAIAKQKASFLVTDKPVEADRELVKAMQHYKKAAESDLRSHWTVTQYLSLAKLLSGQLPTGWFEAAQASAQLGLRKGGTEAIWALATLIELALLDVRGAAKDEQLFAWCKEFVSAVKAEPERLRFEVFSTCRQLRRYTVGQFAAKAANVSELQARAQRALDELDELLDDEQRRVLGISS